MIRFFTLLLSLALFQSVWAQEGGKITYSEEPDTLAKQLFIDRYQNIFMTKVPTRHFVKIGYISSLVRGSGINIGYEYKLSPAFSLEAGLYAQTDDNNDGITVLFSKNTRNLEDLWLNVKARWYYNMKKRIEKGLAANNFNGSYLALSAEQSMIFGNHFPHAGKSVKRIGIQYGFQSRFLNQGHVDFSVGLFHQPLKYGIYEADEFKMENLILATQSTFGIGFGDWKRGTPVPKCEILLCDEFVLSQWKVSFPDAKIGARTQWLSAGLGYERKIGRSPFSLSGYVNGAFYGNSYPDYVVSPYRHLRTDFYNVTGGLQARYYLFQKKQILKGKGGNNLSGLYVGLQLQYFLDASKIANTNTDFPTVRDSHKYWQTGIAAGFQQRLFGRLFVDTSITYLRSLYDVDFPLVTQIVTRNKLLFKAGVGFTF